MTAKGTLFAGLLAIAMLAPLPQFSGTAQAGEYATQGQEATVDVARIKSVLKLTPAQERYWGPVEVALRSLSRRQAQDANGGFVHRVSSRVIQVMLNSAAIERLVVSARPLLRALNDEQKQAAMMLAQEMGFASVVAALN
jgi:hypothetical protein